MARSWGIVRRPLGGVVACALVAVAAAALAPPATSQEPGEGSSTTSTSVDDPAASSTTSTAPSTTVAPVGELEEDLVAATESEEFQEAEAGIRSQGPYAAQPPFDPATANAVFEADLARARARLASVEQAIADGEAALAAAERRLVELDASLGPLRDQEQDVVRRTVEAHEAFTDAAVDAYIRGNDEDSTLLVSSEGATDYAVGRVLMEAALAGDRAAIDVYLQLREGLEAEMARIADELIGARADIDRRRAELEWRQVDRLLAVNEVDTWSAGAHVFIGGYTFPVAGPVRFGDSFGAPRMLGTPYEHWHEGTDIFAAHGTPLVAAEDGVLAGVRSGGVLGGNSLRIVGSSGYVHYYAHLAAFAYGMTNGRPVAAGEVVGFVGDTGNARGTSPHLHYEIQMPDRTSINPFPILDVAHRWRTELGGLDGVGGDAPGG